MYCHNCGKQIGDDAAFCPHCGTKQENSSSDVAQTQEVESFLKQMGG